MLWSCRDAGFCGGSGGYVPFIVDGMERIDAKAFARIVRVAEGFSPAGISADTIWLKHFERVFSDVFGDGQIELGPP
jgi:hypothetical protein